MDRVKTDIEMKRPMFAKITPALSPLKKNCRTPCTNKNKIVEKVTMANHFSRCEDPNTLKNIKATKF